MVPLLLFLFCLGLGIAWSAVLLRRAELERMARTVGRIRQARQRGSHRPRVRAPLIDLTRCMGCTACVKICPEQGVLDMIHGQAAMVHGANCVGHGHCEQSCPSGAIRLDWGELTEGADLPALSADFEVPGRPGLFLIGEATGHGLIRNAVHQGRQVARHLAAQYDAGKSTLGAYDLLVVGAGPGGLACAIEAATTGMRVALLERNQFGGTIYHYPKEKLILTEALHLPGYGLLEAASYTREELLEVWHQAFEGSQVHLIEGQSCSGLTELASEGYEIGGTKTPLRANKVCLATGQSGRPRRLEVPGESLSKVQHRLDDARHVQRERVLVVGGGESAVEAALALAADGSNRVTLAYRGHEFHRVAAPLRQELERLQERKSLRILTQTVVQSIDEQHVYLLHEPKERIRLLNDRVIVQAGSIPPTQFLQDCGVTFGGEDRKAALAATREDIGRAERKRLLQNLGFALLMSSIAALWCVTHWDYYGLALAERPSSASHSDLRPSSAFGLSLGWLALGCLLFNLSYLLRRVPHFLGGLLTPRAWFAVHVATGLLMLPLALMHGALRFGDTTGGHAVLVLIVLVLTGSVGRYLYAFLPRAANGHGLAHEDVRAELTAVTQELRGHADPVGQGIAHIVEELCDVPRWRKGAFNRLWSLRGAQARFHAAQQRLEETASQAGRNPEEIALLTDLLRRSYECSQRARHFDELRSLLGGWRHLHVWLALLLTLLLIAHLVDAWKYGEWWPF